jgi:hypothetical protein
MKKFHFPFLVRHFFATLRDKLKLFLLFFVMFTIFAVEKSNLNNIFGSNHEIFAILWYRICEQKWQKMCKQTSQFMITFAKRSLRFSLKPNLAYKTQN